MKKLITLFLSILMAVCFSACNNQKTPDLSSNNRNEPSDSPSVNLEIPTIPENRFNGDVRIVAISAGDCHAVGLRSDGTVMATGRNYEGQCNVDEWSDIVAVGAGMYHTVGLRSDGTVVATEIDSYNDYGQSDVASWNDIVAISVGVYHTVGLRSDGTVVATKITDSDYNVGQCEVEGWSDIVAISAGGVHTVGLHSDGTVVSTIVSNPDIDVGQSNVADWSDIVAISAGGLHTVGLRSNGTVTTTAINNPEVNYGQCDVASWLNITAISAGENITTGLCVDGTAISTDIRRPAVIEDYIYSEINDGQNNVADWSDIVEISTTLASESGCYFTMGLRSDGTVVAVGENDYGQCNVNSWPDILCATSFMGKTVGEIISTYGQNYILPEDYYSGSRYFYYDRTDLPFIFLFNPSGSSPSEEDVIIAVITLREGMITPELSAAITVLEFRERFGMQYSVEQNSDFDDYRCSIPWENYQIILQWDSQEKPVAMAVVKEG